jgi:hypothetical protein
MIVLLGVVIALLGVAVGIVIGPYLVRRSAFHRGVQVGYERAERHCVEAVATALRRTLEEMRDASGDG